MKGVLDLNDDAVLIRKIDASWLKNIYLNDYDISIDDILGNIQTIEIYKELNSDYHFFYPLSISGDSNFYAKLGKNSWYYFPFKWEHKIAMNYINENSKVLEIGAGYGDFLKQLIVKKTRDVTGLEQNSYAIRQALINQINLSTETIQEHAVINNDSYDIVCAFQVLEHISDVNSFIRSSIRCLKKNGFLIFSVPNNDSFIKYDETNPINMPPHHMGLWKSKSLEYIAGLFSVKLIKLYFEPLQQYHIDWYRRIMSEKYLKSRLLLKTIDKTGANHLINIVVNLLSHGIQGHTILAVYQK